jgi:hypothetical protein
VYCLQPRKSAAHSGVGDITAHTHFFHPPCVHHLSQYHFLFLLESAGCCFIQRFANSLTSASMCVCGPNHSSMHRNFIRRTGVHHLAWSKPCQKQNRDHPFFFRGYETANRCGTFASIASWRLFLPTRYVIFNPRDCASDTIAWGQVDLFLHAAYVLTGLGAPGSICPPRVPFACKCCKL